MQNKSHRDEPDIPTALKDRKQWVDDLYSHPIWEYGEPLHTDGTLIANILGGEPQPYAFRMSDMHRLLDIRIAYVNPDTHCIEADDLNTHVEVWLEAGPMHDNSTDGHTPEPEEGWTPSNRWCASHDCRLDCGGDTLEEAMLTLLARIKTHYNDDGTDKGMWWCSWNEPEKECQGGIGNFCTSCGFLIEPGEKLYEMLRERLGEE